MGHKQKRSNPTRIIVTLVIIVICAVVAAAFAGIQPLAVYKDYVINKVSPFLSQAKSANVSTISIATTARIYVGSLFPNPLCVELRPTEQAKAGNTYKVDLFEEGKLKETSTITWNQPEINVKYVKTVTFHLTDEEYKAYGGGYSLDEVFSVNVHE